MLFRSGKVCRSPVGGVDLVPTIHQFAGLKLPWEMHGHDLSPLLKNPENKWPYATMMPFTGDFFGADTDKIRRWGHDQLTTYGIGRELARPAWAAVGRELMRLGYLAVDAGEFATLSLTESGLDVLKTRAPITLTKPLETPSAKRAAPRREGDIACDEILFARLRALRRELADDRRVPAYIVCGDTKIGRAHV